MLLVVPANIGLRQKCGNKHTSLFVQTVSDEEKGYITLTSKLLDLDDTGFIRGQCYKMFYSCKLRIFVKSLSISPWLSSLV